MKIIEFDKLSNEMQKYVSENKNLLEDICISFHDQISVKKGEFSSDVFGKYPMIYNLNTMYHDELQVWNNYVELPWIAIQHDTFTCNSPLVIARDVYRGMRFKVGRDCDIYFTGVSMTTEMYKKYIQDGYKIVKEKWYGEKDYKIKIIYGNKGEIVVSTNPRETILGFAKEVDIF